jgi:hypothetical protein
MAKGVTTACRGCPLRELVIRTVGELEVPSRTGFRVTNFAARRVEGEAWCDQQSEGQACRLARAVRDHRERAVV